MNVLICHSHTLLARSLAQHLRSRGHLAWAVTRPAAALRILQERDVDVCVFGVSLQEQMGAGVMERALEQSPSTAWVLLAADATQAKAEAARTPGAYAVADPSIPLAVLEELLHDAARRRRSRQPASALPVRREQLSKREQEVLDLVADGLTNGEIAVVLDISVHTVRSHLQAARRKLSARNRVEALSAISRP